MHVRSVITAFKPVVLNHCRDEHWTGSGPHQILLNLDWIRSVNHCNIWDPDRFWNELMEKKCGNFVVKTLRFSFFWTSFGLGLYIKKFFWTVDGLVWINLHWIWIAKYDNSLITEPLFLGPHAAPKHTLCGPQQSFNKTSNILCNRLCSAIKKMCQLTCVKIFLVRFSNKIVGLDLVPFSEKVENNWFKQFCYRNWD